VRRLAFFVLILGCAAPPPRHAGPMRIVVAGDSVAHGEGDESHLSFAAHLDRALTQLGVAHNTPADVAISGSRTSQLARVLERPRCRALVREADAIVISIGGNDLYGDSRARLLSFVAPELMMDLVAERVARIVRTVERESQARIVLLGVYDPYRNPRLDEYVSLWSAKLLERFADDRRVSVITIADLFVARRRISPIDGFHPNADAYERIARRVAEAM
jgi:lysophospholipase L1-like esterase